MRWCVRLLNSVLIFPWIACVSASAQNPPAQNTAPPAYNGAAERVDGVHIPPIPNAAFSAKAEAENTKTLPDGSIVTHRTYNIIARDFRGRVHNEMRAWISPDGSEPKLTYSILYDPDSRTRTILYPARLARQFILKADTKVVNILPATTPLTPTIQKEDLGNSFEDGLQLTGTRETKTYPAGSLGNSEPLAIITEYWYSPDLQLNLSVKRTDPRYGVQSVRLTNLKRGEPDASLFEIPADYRIVNETTTDVVISSGGNAPSSRIRQGGNVQVAKLVNRVQPVYPEEARKNRIQGTVRLHVILGKDGTVQQLEVMSGHPLLQQASLDAVRQWRYQPTLLNGEPVEVDTTIDVIFTLNMPKPSA